jgi:hypothetical protein
VRYFRIPTSSRVQPNIHTAAPDCWPTVSIFSMCRDQCTETCREQPTDLLTSSESPSCPPKPSKTRLSSPTPSKSAPSSPTKSTPRPGLRATIRQVLNDYSRGRKLRKEEAVVAEEVDPGKPAGYGIGWRCSPGKTYPWWIARTIPGDENWRGTWVLEVKDITDVHWYRQTVHDGRSWKSVTLPEAPHWPTDQLEEMIGDCVSIETTGRPFSIW